ncbi:MAG: bifunctional oligoribonuclease/PAP phosphatase NrnA [Oscillospiraceae bacterium]|jgi:phosphoesterase RecJ-like protein|nr:bifunctional oligoribonuclease/PAP phosphatase NrnA [Oscillospiraceae bacterium]
MTINECVSFLRENDNYLIITHIRPDGDTLGCAAALCQALRALGKTAHINADPHSTPRYAPYVSAYYSPAAFTPDTIVTVDMATLRMYPDSAVQFRERVALSIDHHKSNSGYAENTLLDAECAACGELVLRLIEASGAPVTSEIATALYVAVATDTGCFSYDNTTAQTLLAAARLTDFGADIRTLNRELFRSRSRARVAVEGIVYSTMTYHFGGRAAALILTDAQLLPLGADEDDLENIAALPVSISGVEVGVTIRDLPEPGRCKVSLRSSGLDCNALAQRFGGGGHTSAAGFSMTAPPEEIKSRILAAIEELLGSA